jgi:hypothetical protein
MAIKVNLHLRNYYSILQNNVYAGRFMAYKSFLIIFMSYLIKSPNEYNVSCRTLSPTKLNDKFTKTTTIKLIIYWFLNKDFSSKTVKHIL